VAIKFYQSYDTQAFTKNGSSDPAMKNEPEGEDRTENGIQMGDSANEIRTKSMQAERNIREDTPNMLHSNETSSLGTKGTKAYF
jgi:hypothetical protein